MLPRILTSVMLISAVVSASSIFTLVKHTTDRGARCLDGSPAAFYYALGEGQNKNKFVVFFEGGGLCTGATTADTLESCYQRSKSNLGSSAKYPATLNSTNNGILSGDPKVNPPFYDWSRVYVRYCDGSEHMGTRQQPIPYKGIDLYFRGTNNSIEQLESMNQMFGLYNADKVIITGISAGGMATFFWTNYLYDRSVNKQVYSVPDSGLFLIEYVNPFTGQPLRRYLQSLYKLMDTDVDPPIPQCKTDFPDQMQCYSTNRVAKYIKAPLFVVESQYDEWSIKNILQLRCTGSKPGKLTNCNDSQVAAIEDYRKATLAAFQDFDVVKQFGIWAPSCIQHGFEDDSFSSAKYNIPSGSGVTLAEAIRKFVDNPAAGNHRYIDTEGWPSNRGCSGLAGDNLRQE